MNELVVVVALVGVVVAVATLSLQPALQAARLDSTIQEIAFELHLARMKAIAKNTRVRVMFNSEEDSYQIQRDVDGFWQPEGPAKPCPEGIDLVNEGALEFDSTGRLADGYSIAIQGHNGVSKSVSVSLHGRIKVN